MHHRFRDPFECATTADPRRQLLAYPDDTVGGIMHPDAVAVKLSGTVDEAIQVLRTIDEESPIAALYVVDDDRHLLGYVRLRKLLASDSTVRVADVMSSAMTNPCRPSPR